jgi:DNA-binding NtrC family response regulator
MTSIRRIVAVDAEIQFLEKLKQEISGSVTVETFRSGRDALEYLGNTPSVDVVVCGVEIPDIECVRFVKRIKELNEGTQVVALADYSTIEDGIDCVSQGAFSYLLKPFAPDELLAMLKKIDELRTHEHTAAQLGEALALREGHFCGMVGNHLSMRQLFQKVKRASQLPAATSILVQGESGTGKELVARAIHALSAPEGAPFVAVNCGAINANLLEDQLFGRLRGAFTGADRDRAGFFIAAGRGTVFLDEIGEMPIDLQARLLRATQEREVYPLGSDTPVAWNARLVVATNRDLESLVGDGEFRRDLFYRINAIRIDVPPLRSRLDDIPLLVEHFLNRLTRQSRKKKQISREALAILRQYSYPGNVRELQNAIEYAHALGLSDTIAPGDLPREIRAQEVDADVLRPLAEIEREHILRALRRSRGKKVLAARALGIDRNKLYRLIQKFEIKASEIHE